MEDSRDLSVMMTVSSYLYGQLNLPIPADGIRNILYRRGVSGDAFVGDVSRRELDLCTADLYVWVCTGASRVGAVSDSDNGWSHSDGGYTLSESDKSRLMNLANSIYEQYGESKVGHAVVKIGTYGIRPCDYDLDDLPIGW